jgi:hypothetical protein
MSSSEIRWLAALTLFSVVLLAAVGGFTPEIMPDTPGYFGLGPFPGDLASERLPLYAWLVMPLDFGRREFAFVPAAQTALYIVAVWIFLAELRRFGLSGIAVLSTGAALLFSNSLLLDGRWIHPELPAIACALLAFAGVVRLAGSRAGWWAALLILCGAGLCYLLRPSLLPLIVVLPFTYAGLRALRGAPPFVAWTAAVALLAAAPFVAFASVRAWTVGDFNLVSFGGYQMSGMAALMLSDDVVARLPSGFWPLATAVLSARQAAEEAGRIIGVPRNSTGVRSFDSAALSYFDVFARTYDDVTNLVKQQRRPEESWIAFNRRLMWFSLAVVRAAPVRYAAWIFGASKRLLGHAVVANLPLMTAVIVMAITWSARVLTRRPASVQPVRRLDAPVLVGLAFAWLLAAGALTVLTTFPAIRYIDTANLLLAPVPIYFAILMVAPRVAQAERSKDRR